MLNGHRGSILALSFSPDGKLLASAGEDRRVKIWDLGSSSLLKELKGHNESIQCLAWSRDSNLLASGGLDSLVRLWDVQKSSSSSTEAALLQNGPSDLKSESTSFATKCTNIIGLSYSPHNTLLATGIAAAANNPLKTKNNTL